jgi:hypothetical protein
MNVYNIEIFFAYEPFIWSNEAKGKAAVHCVIIGFCVSDYVYQDISLFDEHDDDFVVKEPEFVYGKYLFIYNNDGKKTKVRNVNPYLVTAPKIFIKSRSKPLCDVPEMDFGNMPNDDKGLLSNYSTKEKNDIVKEYPEMKKWFRKILGAEEFINNIERWCIWLKDVSPAGITRSRFLMDVIKKVQKKREESVRMATKKLAEKPYLFGEIRQPTTKYIIIPSTSSERRKYIPIGFISPKIIVNNSVHIIPNTTLYHFGILTSSVHNAWMRAVCGRLKSDYRYSALIVYNNFPWPDVTDVQETTIKELAQAVLDAREQFPECSLADLYNPLTMPPILLKAHKALDKAVMKLYKFGKDMSEAEIVAELMGRYRELMKGEKL